MALVNHAKREINAKIVYYGGEGVGKQALLTYIHDRIKPSLRGELTTMRTGDDSLLFFDFSPFDKPVFGGYLLRFHLYTLPGPVDNPAAWRMTLKGADGVVAVVAASGQSAENRESVARLRDYLSAYGLGLADIPCLLQINRNGSGKPLSEGCSPEDLGMPGIMVCTSDTVTGRGILEAFSQLSREIVKRIEADRAEWPVDRPGPEPCVPVPADVSDTVVSGTGGADTTVMTEIVAAADSDAVLPAVTEGGWKVSLEHSGVRCDKGIVTIPLAVSCNDATCRLTVSLVLDQVAGTGGGE